MKFAPLRLTNQAPTRIAGPRRRAHALHAARPDRAARASGTARRGLAVLELVLSLPVLLFVMATMIGFGTAATWKYRAQVEARNVAWRHIWPRGGEFAEYRTPEWQAPKNVGYQAGGTVAALDAEPYEMPVVRGPLENFTVASTLFDATKGLDEGTSEIDRDFPLLKKMLPHYQFDEAHYLFDNQWQFRQQRMGSNADHRINVLYQMPQPPQDLLQQLTTAGQTATTIHNSVAMQPLDQDAELTSWYGRARNFYPRLRRFTSLDVDLVEQRYVQPLVQQIEGGANGRRNSSGVAGSLTNAFLQMYTSMQNSLTTPPPGLQDKIDQLNQFKKTLQGKN
ncbi:MAG TPA: hypothetical protein VFE24_14175 [Pirellulales bacterium]|jgi:hypothetical protein|nr:hypothetical protein [Pirellulales bacterium]